LKKADKFVWDEEAQKAFEAPKESLTSPPVMMPPVPGETFLSNSPPPLMWFARFSSQNEKKKGMPILFNDLCIT
jgi:hypothetical protein